MQNEKENLLFDFITVNELNVTKEIIEYLKDYKNKIGFVDFYDFDKKECYYFSIKDNVALFINKKNKFKICRVPITKQNITEIIELYSKLKDIPKLSKEIIEGLVLNDWTKKDVEAILQKNNNKISSIIVNMCLETITIYLDMNIQNVDPGNILLNALNFKAIDILLEIAEDY